MRFLKHLATTGLTLVALATLQGCGAGMGSSLSGPMTSQVEAASLGSSKGESTAAGTKATLTSATAGLAASNATTLVVSSTTLATGQVGSAFKAGLTATGGKAPYTWSSIASTLPSGLALTATGTLSGVPTKAGTFAFTVAVTDSAASAQTRQQALLMVISPLPLSVPAATLPAGTAGSSYSASLSVSGGTASYKWALASGSLPAGLTLSSSGAITGTPSVAGTFKFSALVTDSSLPVQTKQQSYTIVIGAAPLAIATTALTDGAVGSTYTAALAATGGTPSYKWSLAGGSLPAGLTLSTAGVLAGKLTTAATTTFTVAVTDSAVPAQRKIQVLTLKAASTPLTITTTTLTNATVGVPYTLAIGATGGTLPYTWMPISGSLSIGLSVSQQGVISGTATQAGTYVFTMAVIDLSAPAQVKTQQYSLTVVPVNITASAAGLTSGQVGTAYAASLTAAGGVGSDTWAITSGSLPAGLTLAATTGAITGKPTTAGTSTFTASVSDSGNPVQKASVTGTIAIADAAPATGGTTWYVRPDGGTRYSTNMTLGQCDGKSDAAYPGSGTNQHCAFNQVMYFWSDGSYADGWYFPAWGWIGSGGDTYIIRGSINDGVSYRLGWNNAYNTYDATTQHYWGKAGDPYGSGMPVPLAGTAAQPTRILGGNYAACTTAGAKTQLHGGYGVDAVINLVGASNVQVECIDATDFSSCSKSGADWCNRNIPLSDYATTGITLSNTTTNVLIQDVTAHGLGADGVRGPTGDGVVMRRIAIRGNPDAGWNADNGTTGSGTLLVQNFDISWNGCSEEYPIVDALPYHACTDDNSGGYGDGFGTASMISSPGWKVTFDTGTVSYNTQDGLDALHLQGSGSSMTINGVLAYGNMGQQIKIGGAAGTATNNLVVTSCAAMAGAIPGVPTGYNSNLSDFCRAANTGVLMTVGKGSRTIFDNNTVYSNAATTFEVECDTTNGACDSTAQIEYRDNIFMGFVGGSGDYANPIYIGASPNPFTNPGSVFDHNVTFHAKSNWSCPATSLNETNAICADPGLVDESWHAYGYGDMTPNASSIVKGAGAAITGITADYTGAKRNTTSPSIGAYE